MKENAAEVGFLRVDEVGRRLLYEGDRERWVIPAEALRSCEPERFDVGGGLPFSLAVIRAEFDGREWEVPVAPRQAEFAPWPIEEIWRQAVALAERVAALLPKAGVEVAAPAPVGVGVHALGDEAAGHLFYEGDRGRWVVPLTDVRSVAVEAGPCDLVVIRFTLGGRDAEACVTPWPLRLRPSTPWFRRRARTRLAARVAAALPAPA